MGRAIVTFAFFLLTQFLLLVVSTRDNVASGGEILVMTATVGLFMFLYFAGLLWARWVTAIALGIFALILTSMTLEGFSFGFLCIAFLHVILIVMLFRRRRVIAAMETEEPQFAPADAQDMPASKPAVTNGFYVGDVVYNYPLLVKRYQSVFIDCMILFTGMIITMVIFGESELRGPVMIAQGVVFVFLYEPLLTAFSATIGQRVMGIRVRNVNDPEKRINVIQAYTRLVVKWLLGWLSFITINFNVQHRAIHDMAGDSVVIKVR